MSATVGDALATAHRAVEAADRAKAAAVRQRAELVRYALRSGATCRSIAALLGVAPATVQRWSAGGERAARPDIDPLALPAPTEEEQTHG